MSKKNEIYDVSAELAREFGEIGTQSRAEATEKAWEEYNAQILLDARKNARLTQAELAEKLNITDRAVSKWENGKSMPDSSVMLELCQILKITVNDLLSGEVVSVNNYNENSEKIILKNLMIFQKNILMMSVFYFSTYFFTLSL